MLNKVLVLLMALSFCVAVGCAKIRYNDEGFSYSRFGKQSTNGVEVSRLADGSITFKMAEQSGDAGRLPDVAAGIAEGVAKGVMKGVNPVP